MKLQTVSLFLILTAIAAFAALNWGVFTEPASLQFGPAEIEAPLGLLMLGLLAALSALFLAFAVRLQAAALREARRQARELHAARELARRAEASRYTALSAQIKDGLEREENLNTATAALVISRLERMLGELRTLIEQSGNTLAAYIGEVEDRLDKGEPPAGGD